MGNANNGFTNIFDNEEQKVESQQNIVTKKSLRDENFKDAKSRNYLFNKQQLKIIDENDNPESNIFIDKKPKDRTQHSIVSTTKEDISLLATPKEIKILENKFNNKFNNNNNNDYRINSEKKNNNNLDINNIQNIMMIDNVYFNSTRKSSPIRKNNVIYKYNNDNNSPFNLIDKYNKSKPNDEAMDSSEDNLDPNKVMNSNEESNNLIVLEYNNFETPKFNEDINLNNINGYNNNDNDRYFQNCNSKKVNNIDSIECSNNMNDVKEIFENKLMPYDNKIDNFNDLMRKINVNYSAKESNNIKEISNDDSGPKDNIDFVNNNKYSINTVKNEFADTLKNLKNNNKDKIKPKLNLNYNEKVPVDNEMNNYTYTNKRKIVQNKHNEKSNGPVDNYIYFNKKIETINKPNSFQINKKKISDRQNNNFNHNYLVILNNRYDKIITNQNDPNKFISNSKEINSKPNQNLIETQDQFTDKPQRIHQGINKPIYYNKTATNFYNTKIYDSPISNNKERNTDINIISNINNEVIIPNYIQSKSNDLLESKNEKIENNNSNNINNNNFEINMSPNERVLYQSAISDNIEEGNLKDTNDILRRSASFGEDKNENNNIEQEINSPIKQNIQDEQNEIGKIYVDSDPNEQNIIERPIFKNDYNSLLIQPKEQIAMNPENEQIQGAYNQEKEINELQKMVIAQSDPPKYKDSKSEIAPKIHEKEPLASDAKQYFQKDLFPISIDCLTFQKKKFIEDNNIDANTNLYKNNINKTNSKIKNNLNENELKEDYENENNFNKEKNNLHEDKFFSIPLTVSKYPDEDNQFISNKESYNNNQKETYENNNNIDNNDDDDKNENENNANNKYENKNENNHNKNDEFENNTNNKYEIKNENNHNKNDEFENNINNKNENENSHYNDDDENENYIDNKYNNDNFIEELECKDFDDFSPDNWKRFYPKDERFFIFSNKDIISNKFISNNTDSINEEIYQGDINKKGEKHGFGKYISPMVKRIGMWRDDKFTGWGREIRENDDIYEGKFIDGKLNGKGIYKDKKNKITYIGDFLNYKFNGKGDLYTKNYHYQGDFNNNKMNGNGRIEIYNQGIYEGTFKDDQLDGNGILKWKDGRYYIGKVSKGQLNGYGEEKFSDGTIYKGNYINGKKQGQGKVITPKGKIIKGEFINGKIKK